MRNAEHRMRNIRRGHAPAVRVGVGGVPRRPGRGGLCRMASRRGAVLLEVILALGLLVAGMAMVGFQVNTALSMARAADLRTRAMMLVDAKMAELDAGVLLPTWIGDELKGYFGIEYPGYSWRMRIKPAEIQNLYLVTLEIGFNESRVQEQIDNPETQIEIDDPGTHILRTVYRLVPKPADVNLQRDFGYTQEELDELINAAAGGDPNAAADVQGGGPTGGGGGGGGGAGPMGDMAAMLSQLIQAIASSGLDLNSINPRDLAQFLDDETLDTLGPLIDMYFGNGMDPSMLPGALDNPMIRNLLDGGRGGRGGRGAGDRGGRGRGRGRDQDGGRDRGPDDGRDFDRDGGRDRDQDRGFDRDQDDRRGRDGGRDVGRDGDRGRNDGRDADRPGGRNRNNDRNLDRNDGRRAGRDNRDSPDGDSRNNPRGNRRDDRRNSDDSPDRGGSRNSNFGGGNSGARSGGGMRR